MISKLTMDHLMSLIKVEQRDKHGTQLPIHHPIKTIVSKIILTHKLLYQNE